MHSQWFFKQVLFSVCLLSLSLSACNLRPSDVAATADPISPPAESLSTPIQSPGSPTIPSGPIEVAFVKDGNVQVWDEATQQTRTITNTGDVMSVTVSDDGQTIAFTRGSWVGDVFEGYEQFALWAMQRDGGNPRELISAQDLRQRIKAGQRDSSNFFQLSWIPRTHQLIFSGTIYIVQGQGLSHAFPQGVYLVDTDDGSVTVLADAAEDLRFLPSPDGKQVALMSPRSLSFINSDGSNRRPDALTFMEGGVTGPLFPLGAWTQDSRAFVMTGSFEKDPNYNIDFKIWRIPTDGSSPEALAAVSRSHPQSVTFSPDGKSTAYVLTTVQQPAAIVEWVIVPLQPEAGALALPYHGKGTFYANLHWSPAGDAFVINDQAVLQLCPDAERDSQVCRELVPPGSGIITRLQWVDASRFLLETAEPNTLSLVKLDGSITPIVTWSEPQRWLENDSISGWSFILAR
jgi:WD40 repeat protein